ncbi:MAG TPA: FtsX-like permease family protein [Candidatus Saccharimonadales bacterium]|nr:FtsX-like permease family protein [Candidatus Saccharimonadales bacterium]
MTFPDILRRSWHNLGRAKVRVGLTAAALAIGAATMTLALAITQGAQDSIQKGFGNFKNNFVSVDGFTVKNSSANGIQTTDEANKANQDAQDKSLGVKDVEKFKAIPGVTQVLPLSYYRFDEVDINGQSYKAPYVSPLTPLDDLNDLVAGKRENLKGDTVIVPERYAKQAGVDASAFIGKKLTFVKKGTPAFFSRPAQPDTEVDLTVVGVTKSSGENKDASTEYAYLSPETMSKLADDSRGTTKPENVYYNRILIFTDESQTEKVKSKLQSDGYEAKTRADSVGKALEAVSAIRTALLVFASIAIFTAIFGVVNTQLMSVLERTREIGVMKALGLSRGGVLLMFSIEAGWIGFLGSIIGTLIAIPFALLLSALGGSAGFSVPITIPNFLLVVVVLVVIAMLSGFLPARRASKLDPVEALRSE